MNRTDILGVRFVNAELLEAVEDGMRAMSERAGKYVVAADSEMLLASRKKKSLRLAVNGAALVLPADSGILCASYILGIPLKKKYNVMDYSSALMARMSEKGRSVYLLGGDEEQLSQAEKRLKERYPGIVLAGREAGNGQTEEQMLQAVNAVQPDLLLVCFGTPGQELWMYHNSGEAKAGLMLGYGRELKSLAGVEDPVPKKWRDAGFEGLYRLIREPRQLLRLLRRCDVFFLALWRRLTGG